MPKRCAIGCLIKSGVSYHQFPHLERNPDSFKAWVEIVGGKLETPSDYEYYRKKVVCDIHFRDCDKNRNNRLNFMAIPSLHLTGVSGHISSAQVSSVHELVANQPTARSGEVVLDVSGHISSAQISSVHELIENQPSSQSSKVVTDIISPTQIIAEHCYCKQRGKMIHKSSKTNNAKFESPLIREQLQMSRRKLKNLHSDLNRLRKKSNNFKTRLASALAMSKDRCLEKLTENMTSAAKIFTKMQCTQTCKRSKGRRFSLEEKVLSLSLYKKSPKCYTLLSSYFTLPSSKSLKRLIAQVKIEAGLNKAIFLKLKETVKQLDPQDRLCCVLFDEMSINPQLHYDAAQDKLRGFAWRSKNFADHVLVYMVKGIKKNFKQPVAYYFTNCLKKNNLKEITLSVIKYVQGTGLNVLCTICDQCTTNVSVINDIIEDENENEKNEGKSSSTSVEP